MFKIGISNLAPQIPSNKARLSRQMKHVFEMITEKTLIAPWMDGWKDGWLVGFIEDWTDEWMECESSGTKPQRKQD